MGSMTMMQLAKHHGERRRLERLMKRAAERAASFKLTRWARKYVAQRSRKKATFRDSYRECVLKNSNIRVHRWDISEDSSNCFPSIDSHGRSGWWILILVQTL